MSVPDFRAYNDALRDKAELDALTEDGLPYTVAEDGEQCIQCLRFTYDPHSGQCWHCGFRLHEEED